MARLVWDTFPKSGSAWLAATLRTAFPESEIVWGNHRITTLKKEENVITCIRQPQDCIPSYMIFFGHDNPSRGLDWYCRFMQGTLESKDRIYISLFEKLIKDPYGEMLNYQTKFLLPEPSLVTKEGIKEEVTKTHPQHLPGFLTSEREKANEMVLSHPDLLGATEIYNKVVTQMKNKDF